MGLEYDLGVDTAEMYGEGAAEQLVGKAIAGCERDDCLLWFMEHRRAEISLRAVITTY